MLSQAHRRSIHTSLEPVLGQEETEALMSELPASESDMPVTRVHFDTTISRLEHRMDLGFANVAIAQAKLEVTVQAAIKDAFKTMMAILVTSLIGGMATVVAIMQAFGG